MFVPGINQRRTITMKTLYCIRPSYDVCFIYICIVSLFVLTYHNEYLVYEMRQNSWTKMNCPHDAVNCTKVLFVADPQLQGDNEVGLPLNYLYELDADRYLTSTFGMVMDFFKPDVILFLGDLMDEGSFATQSEWDAYVTRFYSIFNLENSRAKALYVPGDNDIGGEGGEPIRQDKSASFKSSYGGLNTLGINNVAFIPVDAIREEQCNISMDILKQYHLRVLFSHYPFYLNRKFYKEMINLYDANLLISAHEHKNTLRKLAKDTGLNSYTRHLSSYQLELGEENVSSVFEITVPTCSYRMGTSEIGFGAAVIENGRILNYRVYWSPCRFFNLFLYLIVSLLLLFIIVHRICYSSRRRRRPRTTPPSPTSLLTDPSFEKIELNLSSKVNEM